MSEQQENTTVTIPSLPDISSITDDLMFIASNASGDYHATAQQIADYLTDKFPVLTTPNCVGQFSADSTPDDWYWWPNGVKTPLPVDPATKRFAFYYPDVLEWSNNNELFSGGPDGAFMNYKLTRLESLPKMGRLYGVLRYLPALEVYPVIDCGNLIQMYKRYSIEYMCLNSKNPGSLYFVNTEHVNSVEMIINLANVHYNIFGFDASSLETTQSWPFGINVARLEIRNVGKAPKMTDFDLRSNKWGNDKLTPGARQSVTDTLLNWSFDRAAAGYAPCTLRLYDYTYSLLTEQEIAAITAKGYTIVVATS